MASIVKGRSCRAMRNAIPKAPTRKCLRYATEQRSAILILPSVVARLDNNIVINPAHPHAAKLRPGLERPVPWDARLFAEPPG